MNLTIEQINNGFILKWEEEVEAGDFITITQAVAGDDEKEVVTELLETVAEHFGIIDNKYAEDNLSITWDKKGSKLEDE